MNNLKVLVNGIIKENPTFVLLLGMCPTLGTTSSAINGMSMGLATMCVLILSNFIIALIKKLIPDAVRIPAYIVVIASLVTVLQMVIKAYAPDIDKSLGLFIPLIVVNCIILGRAEGFASKNGIGASAVDGICQGIGYTLVLIVMCVVREFLGSGKFGGGLLGGGALGSAPGITIIPEEFGIKILTLPVGGFLTLGCLIALMQWALAKSAKKKEGK